MSYPRALAVRVLTRVLSDHEPLDEALASITGEVPPDRRAWLQEVCSGTLRWKGRLDSILDSVALKKKASGWLRKVLLVATYQLLVQERTPRPAVVSETVSEVKRKEGEAPARFANAILRKIADHADEWAALALPDEKDVAAGAAWASLPEWLWKRLLRDHGYAWACAFAKAALDRPKLWIVARDPKWIPEWGKPGPVPGSWESTEGGALPLREGFSEGQFIVQDISSQTLVWEISNRVLEALKADGPRTEAPHALDLCAAPGGKAVGLHWRGFSVTASDVHERRLTLLRDTVGRAAPRIRVVSSEELSSVPAQDLVWVDAPCSGTGIIRRHPDVRWLRREAELKGLTATQREVLLRGWESVRPGGFLAYSVCSVLKEEGPQIIEEAGLTKCAVQSWFLTPQEAPGGDGFWAVLLRK